MTFDSTVSCGKCDFCRQGQINLCDNRMVLGVSCGDYRRHGAFAEYVSVPARILYKLPDSLPFERAALIEAVSIAVHAVSRHVPKPDDAVLVVGSGMIGVLVIQVLREQGLPQHHRGRRGRRQARARDARRRHAHAECKGHRRAGCGPRAHRGQGADASFEVVGHGSTVMTAIRSLRKGGTVVLIGNLSPKVEIPLQEVVSREISVLGSCASSGEFPECIDLLARGAVDVDPLISLKASLDEAPHCSSGCTAATSSSDESDHPTDGPMPCL